MPARVRLLVSGHARAVPSHVRRYRDRRAGYRSPSAVRRHTRYPYHGRRGYRDARAGGRDWPERAETMIGLRRLDNLERCIRTVVDERVPGDLLEAGVWRGGAVIFMRAMLEVLGDEDRIVWAADSFKGLPKPDE